MHRVPETLISSGLGFLFIPYFFFFFFLLHKICKSNVIIIFKIQSVHLLFFRNNTDFQIRNFSRFLLFSLSPLALVYYYFFGRYFFLFSTYFSSSLSIHPLSNSTPILLVLLSSSFLFFPVLFVSLYSESFSPFSPSSPFFISFASFSFSFRPPFPSFSVHSFLSLFRIFT